MIDLCEHGKIAYGSAVAMLVETGCAAVIHPTGTGKSFIDFKLCEDFTNKLVCWLSPSESGCWLCTTPQPYRTLTDDQISRLESIGMVWNRNESGWDAAYAVAFAYSREHGTLRVPTQYRTPDGFGLGEWLRGQRRSRHKGVLSDDRIRKLNDIGMIWS